jgi:hypothetical protein
MVVSGDSEVCTAASSPLGPIEIEIEIEIEMSWPGGLAGGREFRHSRKTDESDLNQKICAMPRGIVKSENGSPYVHVDPPCALRMVRTCWCLSIV